MKNPSHAPTLGRICIHQVSPAAMPGEEAPHIRRRTVKLLAAWAYLAAPSESKTPVLSDSQPLQLWNDIWMDHFSHVCRRWNHPLGTTPLNTAEP